MDVEAAGQVGHGTEAETRVGGGRVLGGDGVVEVATRAVLHHEVERVLGLDDRGHVDNVRVAVVGGRGQGEVDVDLLALEEELGLGEALFGKGLDGLVLDGRAHGLGKVDVAVGAVAKDVEDLVSGVVGFVPEDVADPLSGTVHWVSGERHMGCITCDFFLCVRCVWKITARDRVCVYQRKKSVLYKAKKRQK